MEFGILPDNDFITESNLASHVKRTILRDKEHYFTYRPMQ